jgi:response regulator RpfG family c-di-GMP phosphodiesterase
LTNKQYLHTDYLDLQRYYPAHKSLFHNKRLFHYGLKGDRIPLPARIVSLADVFDALSTRRPYKNAMEFDTVKNMLIADSGKHFDPDVVLAFCKREKDIRKIMKKYAE